MSIHLRTLVRMFLLVGGAAYAVFGVVSGSSFEIGFGALAALLGAFGLWWEHRDASDETWRSPTARPCGTYKRPA
jgi:protein-S-isoprenylcysteine O-methyltransferase Ste14